MIEPSAGIDASRRPGWPPGPLGDATLPLGSGTAPPTAPPSPEGKRPSTPSGPGRRGRRVALVVAGLAVAALVVVGASFLVGGEDDVEPLADDSTVAASPPADSPPTVAHRPDNRPARDRQARAQARTVLSAVEKHGFSCYDTLRRPVTVNRCFLDPAAGTQQQTVSVVSHHGVVREVRVAIEIRHSAQRSRRLFTGVVRALRGPLLSARDVRTVLSTPADRREFRIDWGAATQSHDARSGSHEVSLVARGRHRAAMPRPQSMPMKRNLRRALAERGFACRTARGRVSCEVERHGIHYRATGVAASCSDRGRRSCPRHDRDLTVLARYTKATRPTYRRIADYLDNAVRLGAGQESRPIARWIRSGLDGDRHVADLGGLNLSIEPGSDLAGKHPSVVSLTISQIEPGG